MKGIFFQEKLQLVVGMSKEQMRLELRDKNNEFIAMLNDDCAILENMGICDGGFFFFRTRIRINMFSTFILTDWFCLGSAICLSSHSDFIFKFILVRWIRSIFNYPIILEIFGFSSSYKKPILSYKNTSNFVRELILNWF